MWKRESRQWNCRWRTQRGESFWSNVDQWRCRCWSYCLLWFLTLHESLLNWGNSVDFADIVIIFKMMSWKLIARIEYKNPRVFLIIKGERPLFCLQFDSYVSWVLCVLFKLSGLDCLEHLYACISCCASKSLREQYESE